MDLDGFVTPGLGDTSFQPPDQFDDARRRSAWVVDARDRDAYAATHLPGSITIELDTSFARHVGWMLPYDSPIPLVLPEPEIESLAEAVTQLIRIGWSRMIGDLPARLDELPRTELASSHV